MFIKFLKVLSRMVNVLNLQRNKHLNFFHYSNFINYNFFILWRKEKTKCKNTLNQNTHTLKTEK